MYKKNIDQLFARNMTRRQFLAAIGVALLALIGVRGMLAQLSRGEDSSSSQSSYDPAKYGGK